MKRSILFLAVISVISSCCNNNAKLAATVNNADNKDIVISKLEINNVVPVDTVKADKAGKFTYDIKFADENPQFYYVYYNNTRVASLIVKPKDKIELYADTLAGDYKIEGSEESKLLKTLDSTFNISLLKYKSLVNALIETVNEGNDPDRVSDIKKELGKVYVKQKQNALKSILSHPYSFSNIPALYQKFSESLPLFAEFNDGFIVKKVCDSLQSIYPNSAYVKLLRQESENFDKQMELQKKLSEAQVANFPNIMLPDINSKNRELNELQGKPFILYFWGAADVKQKMFNRELKDLYEKYHEKGLEIYQVSVDTDKTLWATAVKEQELPWINVCDGMSGSSQAVTTYNINTVPTLFVFDSEGQVVARDEYEKSKLDDILRGICK